MATNTQTDKKSALYLGGGAILAALVSHIIGGINGVDHIGASTIIAWLVTVSLTIYVYQDGAKGGADNWPFYVIFVAGIWGAFGYLILRSLSMYNV